MFLHTFSFVDKFSHAHHSPLTIFDWKAEHVSRSETSVLVHLLEELGMFVSILDVH